MQLNPTPIFGSWDEGFALDLHTISSEYLGDDGAGHPRYDTKRSELGELLYRLKYRDDFSAVPTVAEAASGFVQTWHPGTEIIVPVPPNKQRPRQPLFAIANEMGRLLALPVSVDAIESVRETPELKDIADLAARGRALKGAHAIRGTTCRDRRVLLVDDLFRSGATLNAIAGLLRASGASAVFVLALTRTRRLS